MIKRFLTAATGAFFLLPAYFAFLKILRSIKTIDKSTHYFLIGREDFGAVVQAVDYAFLWKKTRSDVVLVSLSIHQNAVHALVKAHGGTIPVIQSPAWWGRLPREIHRGLLRYLTLFLSRFLSRAITIYDPVVFALENRLVNRPSRWLFSQYNEHFDSKRPSSDAAPEFVQSYLAFSHTCDCNWLLYHDFAQLKKAHWHAPHSLTTNKKLVEGKYVVLCLRTAAYNTVQRNIDNVEPYSALIDHLIHKGYSVVNHGRAATHPRFAPRKGFFDYAHSPLASTENDLSLFQGAEFCITSKGGVEEFALLFNKPVLSLNFTEMAFISPSPRYRFHPKKIFLHSQGRYMNWKELLHSPIFFQVSESIPWTKEGWSYEELSAEELKASVDEFIELLHKEQWEAQSLLQQEWKSHLKPYHYTPYFLDALPLNAYLQAAAPASQPPTPL